MNETLVQSLTVMFIGIGTVMAFLGVTILAMLIMAKIVKKLNEIFPEAVTQTAGAARIPAAADNEDENIAVAILSALQKK